MNKNPISTDENFPMFFINVEEWEKLKWYDSGIKWRTYRTNDMWENGYNVIGKFAISGIQHLETLYQKDGQMYICRLKLAKVYPDGNNLISGEKKVKPMPDLWEEDVYKNLSINYNIYVRRDGIIYCDRDPRFYNFLWAQNNVVPIPEFQSLKYEACDISYLDIFKKAVEKYPKYKLVYQPEKSINRKG